MRLALAAASLVLIAGCSGQGPRSDAPAAAGDSATDTSRGAPGADRATQPPGAERTKRTTVTLALQPTDNAQAIAARASELERFLETTMAEGGVDADVVVHVPLSAAGVVEALRFGHADVAMLSAWPATLAAERAGARIVLAEQREVMIGDDATVGPSYRSYHVVMRDSPHHTLADLKGATIAYSSPTSTSGYVFPLAKLVEEGLVARPTAGHPADPKEHFGEVIFAGGYRQAWEALRHGQVDVAVTAGDVPASLYQEVLSETRVVAEQGPIPSHAVVYAKDFTGAPADALTRAFLALKGEHRDVMRELVSGIFVSFEETTTEAHVAGLASALAATRVPHDGDHL